MRVEHIAAFSEGDTGGNPAGVVLADRWPADAAMQVLAAEVGYSETAFAVPEAGGWRVRYFAPEQEVPFCGHATIALGAALARQHGDGAFALRLNAAEIGVEGRRDGVLYAAALVSPPTRSAPAPAALLDAALALFGYAPDDLDPRLPPALAEAGARHLLLALTSRRRLAEMRYDQATGAVLMREAGLATISLLHESAPGRFASRNPFAAGGVYEDPATGAAAAALGGYLRDLGWPHGGAIEILQGEDMGTPCRLHAAIPPTPGAGIRVSGTARFLA